MYVCQKAQFLITVILPSLPLRHEEVLQKKLRIKCTRINDGLNLHLEIRIRSLSFHCSFTILLTYFLMGKQRQQVLRYSEVSKSAIAWRLAIFLVQYQIKIARFELLIEHKSDIMMNNLRKNLCHTICSACFSAWIHFLLCVAFVNRKIERSHMARPPLLCIRVITTRKKLSYQKVVDSIILRDFIV